jgi:hypothetical protein
LPLRRSLYWVFAVLSGVQCVAVALSVGVGASSLVVSRFHISRLRLFAGLQSVRRGVHTAACGCDAPASLSVDVSRVDACFAIARVPRWLLASGLAFVRFRCDQRLACRRVIFSPFSRSRVCDSTFLCGRRGTTGKSERACPIRVWCVLSVFARIAVHIISRIGSSNRRMPGSYRCVPSLASFVPRLPG